MILGQTIQLQTVQNKELQLNPQRLMRTLIPQEILQQIKEEPGTQLTLIQSFILFPVQP